MPRLLQRCIDSIPDLDYLETIIVDDNSDPAIVDFTKFPGIDKPRTKVILTKSGRGAGFAWNEGIRAASGDFIIFCDADDLYNEQLPKALEAYKDTSYDVVVFPIKVIDSETFEPHGRDSWYNNVIYDDTIDDHHKLALAIPGWSKIISRDFLIKNNIECEEIFCAIDVMLGSLMAVHAKNIKIDRDFAFYCLTFNQGSLTTLKDFRSIKTRTEAAIRQNRLYRQHGKKDWVRPIPTYLFAKNHKLNILHRLNLLWRIFITGNLFVGLNKRN